MKILIAQLIILASLALAFISPADATIRDQLGSSLTLTAGAESTDVIAVTVAGLESTTYQCELIDQDAILLADTAYTVAESGDGTPITDNTEARLLFSTSAGGAATLDVTDVSGGTDTSIYMVCAPLGAVGEAEYVTLTFDATDSSP